MVNSSAASRRHAAAVKIGSVYELEYARESRFGFAGDEKFIGYSRKEILPSVAGMLSHQERSKLPAEIVHF